MTDWLDVLNPREWAMVTWIAIALFAGIRFFRIRRRIDPHRQSLAPAQADCGVRHRDRLQRALRLRVF